MGTCDVCGKETNGNERAVSLHKASLLKRATKKGSMGSSTTSVYKNFSIAEVRACPRHTRALWLQRLLSGFLVLILVILPIAAILSIFFNIRENPQLSIAVILIIALVPTYLMVRRIAYDAFIAGLMNMRRQTGEERVEYFGEAKYQRLMKRIAALDAEIAREDKIK